MQDLRLHVIAELLRIALNVNHGNYKANKGCLEAASPNVFGIKDYRCTADFLKSR